MQTFTDVNEKISDTLSECDDARVINNLLLSYIINKCAGDVVLLCDVLKNVVSTDNIKQLQDLGTYNSISSIYVNNQVLATYIAVYVTKSVKKSTMSAHKICLNFQISFIITQCHVAKRTHFF